MDINMVDVTIHINENIGLEKKRGIEDKIRSMDGVLSVGYHQEKPHLMVVEYNPDEMSSEKLLSTITESGVHAQLIGL